MDAIFGSPLPVIAIGALSVAILISGLFKTGRIELLYLAGLALLLTIGMVFVERAVVTLEEEIDGTLRQIAGDLESGVEQRVLSHISTTAEPLKQEAKRLWPRVQFHEVKVKNNLEIEAKNERSVTANFNAVLIVSEKGGAGDRHHVPSYFVVDLVNEDGRWKIERYERHDPRQGIQ